MRQEPTRDQLRTMYVRSQAQNDILRAENTLLREDKKALERELRAAQQTRQSSPGTK